MIQFAEEHRTQFSPEAKGIGNFVSCIVRNDDETNEEQCASHNIHKIDND